MERGEQDHEQSRDGVERHSGEPCRYSRDSGTARRLYESDSWDRPRDTSSPVPPKYYVATKARLRLHRITTLIFPHSHVYSIGGYSWFIFSLLLYQARGGPVTPRRGDTRGRGPGVCCCITKLQSTIDRLETGWRMDAMPHLLHSGSMKGHRGIMLNGTPSGAA